MSTDGGSGGGDAPPPRCGAPPSRCGARLRTGGSCPLPPAAGKRRCFQHGGARGIGAPKGNRNNWQDGFYGRDMKEERRQVNALIRQSLEVLRMAKELRADEPDRRRAPRSAAQNSE